MKTLKQIREAKSGGKEAYQKFFNSLLKKYGVKSPAELDDEQKKKFYNDIDKGWESDDPNDKNERYEDPDNLNPETDDDADEDQADKAASKDAGPLKAHKMKLKAGYNKMNAAYHKESVTEALKAGKGNIKNVDVDMDATEYSGGEKAYVKDMKKKYKVAIKMTRMGALLSGKKADVIKFMQSDDYGMDDEDIEDMFPELLEDTHYPKPLGIIRQNKVSDDALEEAYGMNEKMGMCEHCGKMHEEGACGDMNESEIHLDAKSDKFKKIKKSQYAAIKKKYSVTIDSDKTGSWAAGKPADLHKFAMDMGMSKDDIKKTYNHITPDYKGASNVKNRQREEVEEAMSMRSIGLKGASKRSRETGRKAKEGPALKGAKLGKSQPVLNRSQENEIHKIAKKHSGDMEKAMKEIEKMRVWKGKGIQDHPYVMDVLRQHNEEIEEKVEVDGRLIGFKSAQRRAEGEKQKGKVIVDRRTKGYKEAKVRSEKAKAKRLEAKKAKEFAEKYPELDYAYGDAAELKKTMEAASEVMGYKKKDEDAAVNNVGDGNVDMNTTGKSKKKKKELMAKRGY